MNHLAYLLALLIPIGCLLLVDRRWHVAFWYDRSATVKTLASAVIIFIAWDAIGVDHGIFFIGNNEFLTGIRIYHEIPVEEVFFLFLLNFTALLTYRLVSRKVQQ